MITAAEVRRQIAENEKKSKASRRQLQRVIGDVPRAAAKASGGVKALSLLTSAKNER